jgi:radical SAM superfamily enzyme YgiQ (UPF0313 family)
MKEILVVSPTPPHWYLSPVTSELVQSKTIKPISRQPLWVCAVLEEAGFSVHYLPLQDLYPTSCDPAVEKELVNRFDCPVMILFPRLLTSTSTYYNCGRIASVYKETTSGKVVLSGYHASTLPEETLSELDVDIIAPFEFLLNSQQTTPLLEALLQDKEPTCHGIFLKRNGKICRQPPASPVVEDLTALPPPKYTMLSPYLEQISRSDSIWIDIVTSRGCPFKCAYCSSIPTREYHTVRYLSSENVAAEIDEAKKAFGSKVLWEAIYDELFAYNKEHLLQMKQVFEEKDIKFSLAFGRCSLFSKEIAEIMSQYTEGVVFGAETCNQLSLDMVHKKQTFDDVITALKIAKEYCLTTVLQWMVGLPGETTSTIYKTLSTMTRLYTSGLADRIDVQILVPFTWTDIYRNPQQFGIDIHSRKWDEYNELGYYPVYCTDTLSRQQIWSYFLYTHLTNIYARALRNLFPRDVYKSSLEHIAAYFSDNQLYKSAFLQDLFEHGGIH